MDAFSVFGQHASDRARMFKMLSEMKVGDVIKVGFDDIKQHNARSYTYNFRDANAGTDFKTKVVGNELVIGRLA